jgi:hypothetical protein
LFFSCLLLGGVLGAKNSAVERLKEECVSHSFWKAAILALKLHPLYEVFISGIMVIAFPGRSIQPVVQSL